VADLKDPLYRDEDISNTEISADYSIRSDGLFEYTYKVVSDGSNKGIISRLLIGLECFEEVEPASSLPGPPANEAYDGNSAEKPIVPSRVLAEYGSSGSFGITASGEAIWSLYQKPGETTQGLKIVSATEPGLRRYRLVPFMDNNPNVWDYESYDAHDPRLPWIEDFTVTGMIAGPSCPGVTPPLEEEVFFGNRPGRETKETNRLLAYTAPLKNRLHVDGKKTFAMTVRYGDDIDPKSFHVQPGWLQPHFHPYPGAEETVEIPLKRHRTKVQLEVHPAKATGPEASRRKGNEAHHSRKDRDVFEVRHDGIAPKPRAGRGKDPSSGNSAR